jgi:DnaA regulatory inactivator Hda
MSVARQYPLPLPYREAMEADDFLVAPSNQEAVAWIDRWPDWPSHCLVIYGPSGAGKTHLAHVWRTKSRGKIIAAAHLATADPGAIVMANRTIVIDDAETTAGNPAREEGLFHLYNILRENGGHLLLTASKAPAQWSIRLADLRSRLSAAPAILLAPPDDALIAALLIKQFRDRQIDIAGEVIDFLLPRMERTPGAIREMVAALDRASLALGRKITVALARQVMETINAS